MASSPSTNTGIERGAPIRITLLVLLGLCVVAGGVLWFLEREVQRAANPDQLSAEGKAYVHNLQLSDVGLQATENSLHQAVVEILGKIKNAGDRPVKSAAVYCIFRDRNQQIIARERVAIIRSSGGGLAPGATRDFRLPFDNIPPDWNNVMPQLVIAQVQF